MNTIIEETRNAYLYAYPIWFIAAWAVCSIGAILTGIGFFISGVMNKIKQRRDE